MATKKELLKMLEKVDDHTVIVCMDDKGGWGNIKEVKKQNDLTAIVFGGGSPFSED